MKIPKPPVYEARFGRKDEDGPGMDLLAAYAISGFKDGSVSRFDQVMAGMVELPLPPEVDWVEIDRKKQEAAAQATGLRVVTRSGLVAELLDTSPDAAPMPPALPARLVAGDTPPGGIELPAFPIQSIFAN